MCVGQTAVCSGVPVVCEGEGECEEDEDRECEAASLCSSSTLLWSSALRNSSSFKVWWTGTWNTHHTITASVTSAILCMVNSKVHLDSWKFYSTFKPTCRFEVADLHIHWSIAELGPQRVKDHYSILRKKIWCKNKVVFSRNSSFLWLFLMSISLGAERKRKWIKPKTIILAID